MLQRGSTLWDKGQLSGPWASRRTYLLLQARRVRTSRSGRTCSKRHRPSPSTKPSSSPRPVRPLTRQRCDSPPRTNELLLLSSCAHVFQSRFVRWVDRGVPGGVEVVAQEDEEEDEGEEEDAAED